MADNINQWLHWAAFTVYIQILYIKIAIVTWPSRWKTDKRYQFNKKSAQFWHHNRRSWKTYILKRSAFFCKTWIFLKYFLEHTFWYPWAKKEHLKICCRYSEWMSLNSITVLLTIFDHIYLIMGKTYFSICRRNFCGLNPTEQY